MVLSFSGDLTIRKAEEIRAKLVESLASDDRKIIISCSDVEEVDLSFVQLVISARKSAAATGREVALAAPAEGALLETLTRGGFVGEAEMTDKFWVEGGK